VSVIVKAAYIKTQLQSAVNISKIVTIHYFEFGRNFVFEGESHNFWEIVYIDKGRVAVCRDEEEISLGQGEIVFHRPNEFHSIRALDSAPSFFVVSFVCTSPAMSYFERYHTTLSSTHKNFITSIIREAENSFIIPKNDPMLKKLEKKSDALFGGEQLIKTYLEQLLILLIRNVTGRGESVLFPSRESMENHLVGVIRELLERRAESTVRVEEICTELGYSKSYLQRLFRAQTGDTIASYAMKVKINRAKQYIREGEMNFTQISDRLEFDNPQYFSRVFKRVTGLTPSEFRGTLDFGK